MHHVYSMLKRRGNDRFHVVSTWNTCGVFVVSIVSINPFQASSVFRLPLKTSRNQQCFFGNLFYGDFREGILTWNWSIVFKKFLILISFLMSLGTALYICKWWLLMLFLSLLFIASRKELQSDIYQM